MKKESIIHRMALYFSHIDYIAVYLKNHHEMIHKFSLSMKSECKQDNWSPEEQWNSHSTVSRNPYISI